MGRRALADGLYVAVYRDEDGKDCFAFWGSYDNRRIRWYKTRAEGDRQLAEMLRPEETRKPKPPENTRIVKFVMGE